MPRYHVHRSIQIEAPPQQVFQVVSDFGTWITWSPWLCAEPDAQVAVSEDATSVGSVYSWKGEIVGEGEIEHQRLEPERLIEEEIRFVKPFKSKSQVSFEMEPIGSGTKLAWHMRGSLPWFLFWMRPQMEIFIGMDYERGLKMLKEWIETGNILSTTKILGVQSVGPLRMAGVRTTCSFDEIGSSMENTFCQVKQMFDERHLPISSEGISVYHTTNMKSRIFEYTGGFIVGDSGDSKFADFSTWSIPQMQALQVEHTGSYDHVGNAWSAAFQVARYKKLKLNKIGTFEIYHNNPDDTAPADLRTTAFLPLK